MGGKHEHFGGRDGFKELSSGENAVEDRHRNIHQDHLGAEFLDQGDRLTAVLRFADHFQIGFEV